MIRMSIGVILVIIVCSLKGQYVHSRQYTHTGQFMYTGHYVYAGQHECSDKPFSDKGGLPLVSNPDFTGQPEYIQEKIFVHTDKPLYHAGETIWLKLYVTEAGRGVFVDLSKVAYVELLDTANHPVQQAKVRLSGGTGSGYLALPANLLPGRYLLRAYTNWMKNFPPELYFEKELIIVNMLFPETPVPVDPYDSSGKKQAPRDDGHPQCLRIDIRPHQQQYAARDKIQITIATNDGKGRAQPADLSISVYRLDSLTKVDESDILSGLTAVPLFTGQPSAIYPPEYNGHIITGRITDKTSGAPAAGVNGYLSLPGSQAMFYNSVSKDDGSIVFEARYFTGGERVVVQTAPRGLDHYRVHIDDPFSKFYPGSTSGSLIEAGFRPAADPGIALAEHYPLTLLDQGVGVQVRELYDTGESQEYLPLADSGFFFGSGTRYVLEDYVQFPTMEEVFREYVQPIGVKRVAGKLFPFIFDDVTHQPYSNNPLFLLDGIPVFNMEKLMSYDPRRIKSIEIVASRYYRGRSVFDGVVNMVTYKGIAEGYEPDDNTEILSYGGLQPKRKFPSPDYSSLVKRAERLPDFRNVLYWHPEQQTDPQGKLVFEFYASDLGGEYVVIVQGAGPGGQMGSGTAFFSVIGSGE